MKDRWVYAELNSQGTVIRIFRNRKDAYDFKGLMTQVSRKIAVHEIRHQLFLRSKGACELCLGPVIELTGHMHERQHRGKGGEISLENSIFICEKCHRYQHRDRNPHFSSRLPLDIYGLL